MFPNLDVGRVQAGMQLCNRARRPERDSQGLLGSLGWAGTL